MSTSVFKAAVDFLQDGLEDATFLPVYVQLDPGSVLPDRVPAYLSLVFFDRANTEAEEDAATGYREELWTWYVYLVLASENKDPVDLLDQVGRADEDIRGGLLDGEVDAFADGIRVTSLQFAGFGPGCQIYRTILTYHRTEG